MAAIALSFRHSPIIVQARMAVPECSISCLLPVIVHFKISCDLLFTAVLLQTNISSVTEHQIKPSQRAGTFEFV